ncbi:twitchin [Sinocyclocheilus rhinocerous]|uniref:twitchin n=1 Tax=Sinocyclocheilus rhinocerous TaxID=307959 RepID=UPI0007B7E319|nr:PREDICTED: twitchin-like [Sinocyclocheilus rhinocerous]
MKTLGEVFNLFVCVILSRFNAVTSIIYVENGKSVTLNPNVQGNPEDILWTFNGNKVAEHDLNEFQEYGQFRGRSEIQITTGQLSVLRMTSQDSGIYRSAIQIDGKLQNSENEVQVIDAVQEPNVTCILNNITESKTLFCSVSSQFQTTFEWTGSNSIQHSGQELHISKEEKPDSVFTCTVKNEVSLKSTSFALKDCLTDENIILPVILAIIGAIIVVITMAVAFYFICQRRNKGKTYRCS